jgi:hypothetical protein
MMGYGGYNIGATNPNPQNNNSGGFVASNPNPFGSPAENSPSTRQVLQIPNVERIK